MKKILQKIAVILTLTTTFLVSTLFVAPSAFAEPESSTSSETETIPDIPSDSNDETGNNNELILPPTRVEEFTIEDTSEGSYKNSACAKATGPLSWFLCSSVNALSSLVDSIYGLISNILVIRPFLNDQNSAIFLVWDKVREITNLFFIILLLVVIYSQFTGIGINNYNIKRALPRVVIAIILVNLSFLFCAAAVDISNIVGSGLTTIFDQIQSSIPISEELAEFRNVSWNDFSFALTGLGTVAALASIVAGGPIALFWMFVVALAGAAISVIIGLVTISLRQGVIMVLVMVAPLAFIAYTLPNTEKWFTKWKDLFFQMLFFYPMFSFLFATCKFIGWAIMVAPGDKGIQFLLGLAVQVLPLIFTISLLKMSNTILGRVSGALDRFSMPLRRSIDQFGGEKIEQSRQRYIASPIMPGSHLRRFLQNRQALRALDTAENTEYNKNRALEHALTIQSSSRNRLESGHATWNARANRYTSAAKRNSLQKTRTATAQQNLSNTLSEYGSIFHGRAAGRLSGSHAEAFKDNMKQEFWAENIAQSDQSFLLDSYINATKNRFRAPYEYNRLIRDAAGSSGHIGEASIMGQVIKKSVEIEGRRRTEAAVMINKFNFKKGDFRGMVFDKAVIDDDGLEIGPDGKPIENDQFKFKKGMAGLSREWGQYIYVNADGKEISPEAYRSLSKPHQSAYKRVKYINIYDDDGNVMQRVYDDDNGYMKEMLRNDIAIGDPINIRYAKEIGVKHRKDQLTDLTAEYAANEKTGRLRKYHSTISAAFREFGYAEHDAAFTAMLQAQLNSGYITDMTQLNIARCESIWKAAKSGKILQNDAKLIRYYADILNSLNETGERNFDYFFQEEGIALYRNVNEGGLKGFRLITKEDGTKGWEVVDRDKATAEEKRNFLIHEVIYNTAKKYLGSINRQISNNVAENQKSDATDELRKAVARFEQTQIISSDENIPFEERLRADENIFKVNDPEIIRRDIGQVQNRFGLIDPKKGKKQQSAHSDNPTSDNSTSSNNSASQSTAEQPQSNQSSTSTSSATNANTPPPSDAQSPNQPPIRHYTGQADPSAPNSVNQSSFTTDEEESAVNILNNNLSHGIDDIHNLIETIREISVQVNKLSVAAAYIMDQCKENQFLGDTDLNAIRHICDDYKKLVSKDTLDKNEKEYISKLCADVISHLQGVIGRF